MSLNFGDEHRLERDYERLAIRRTDPAPLAPVRPGWLMFWLMDLAQIVTKQEQTETACLEWSNKLMLSGCVCGRAFLSGCLSVCLSVCVCVCVCACVSVCLGFCCFCGKPRAKVSLLLRVPSRGVFFVSPLAAPANVGATRYGSKQSKRCKCTPAQVKACLLP